MRNGLAAWNMDLKSDVSSLVPAAYFLPIFFFISSIFFLSSRSFCFCAKLPCVATQAWRESWRESWREVGNACKELGKAWTELRGKCFVF